MNPADSTRMDRLERLGAVGAVSAVVGLAVVAGWHVGRDSGNEHPGQLLVTWLFLGVVAVPGFALAGRQAWSRSPLVDAWSTMPLSDRRLLLRLLGPDALGFAAVVVLLGIFAGSLGVGAGWRPALVAEAVASPMIVAAASSCLAALLVRGSFAAIWVTLVVGMFAAMSAVLVLGTSLPEDRLRRGILAGLALLGLVGGLGLGKLVGRATLRRLREGGTQTRGTRSARRNGPTPPRDRDGAITAILAGDPGAPRRVRRLVVLPLLGIAAASAPGISDLRPSADPGAATVTWVAIAAAGLLLAATAGSLPHDRPRPRPGEPTRRGSALDPLPVSPLEVLAAGRRWWGGLLAIWVGSILPPLALWPRDPHVAAVVVLASSLAGSMVLLLLLGELKGLSCERPEPRSLGSRQKAALVGLAVVLGVVPWLVLVAEGRGTFVGEGADLFVRWVQHPWFLAFLEGAARALEVPRAFSAVAATVVGGTLISMGLAEVRKALRVREERSADIWP